MFADWHLKIRNELSFADIEFNGFTLHANTTFELDATPEEAVIRKEERQELLRLLAALPEEDRRLVIASVQDGMDFGKLAELFGLSNRNYASKKTGRILERMRRDAQNFNR